MTSIANFDTMLTWFRIVRTFDAFNFQPNMQMILVYRNETQMNERKAEIAQKYICELSSSWLTSNRLQAKGLRVSTQSDDFDE